MLLGRDPMWQTAGAGTVSSPYTAGVAYTTKPLAAVLHDRRLAGQTSAKVPAFDALRMSERESRIHPRTTLQEPLAPVLLAGCQPLRNVNPHRLHTRSR